MKTISLICPTCLTAFVKAHKEYTRQIKTRSNYLFFCSRRCAGLNNINIAHLERVRYPLTEGLGVEAARRANTKYTPEQRPFVWFVRQINKRMNGIDTDINIDFLRDLWAKQQGLCAITNLPLVLDGKNKSYAASLDRKDSSKGYTRDNVQFVSCRINWAKSNSSDEDIKEFIRIVVEANR